MRGNPWTMPYAGQRPGSIPACAGEPTCSGIVYNHSAVYPRVCGGTAPTLQHHPPKQGLSPRVRGNPLMQYLSRDAIRSIPACAGEPHAARRRPSESEVYPRVCGGTQQNVQVAGEHSGLSPRVRGNQGRPVCRGKPSRSIPACAGEPGMLRSALWRPPVYPRVCGGTSSSLAAPLRG